MQLKPTPDGLLGRLTAEGLGFTPTRLWNPSPTDSHSVEPYPLPKSVKIGVRDTVDSAARYSPPPFAVVVENDEQRAMVGVVADAGWHRWNEAVFTADSGGVEVSIDLENMTDPKSAAEHVRIEVVAGSEGESRMQVLANGLAALYPQASEVSAAVPEWWLRPSYCGWGDQVSMAMFMEGVGAERRALAYCIQGLYERWLDRLDAANVPIGTITIDAGWSPPGTWEPTPTMWPDMRGFIDRQHEKGRRVLLWIPTWYYDGLPDEWCIHAGDRPITSDPTHPKYLDHVRRQVHKLLSPDGLNADGFKIDQLSHCPSTGPYRFGPRFGWATMNEPDLSLRMHGDGFGCELLHTLTKTIYDAAKSAKPDALVTSSTVHPYFHDTCDMVRIHDMGTPADDIFAAMQARADLGRATLPGKPVDADDWIHIDYDMWMRYTMGSHTLGVPCTFYTEHFVAGWKKQPLTVPIPQEDLEKIAAAWRGAGFK